MEHASFGSLDCHFWRKSRERCSFWKLGVSLLVKVLWKILVLEALVEMLVLEAWIFTFGEGLVENARFGSLDCHFWRTSRGKCSFWKLGVSLLVKVLWKILVLEAVKVSWKMLVLEAWIFTFGESLVENACFGTSDSHF